MEINKRIDTVLSIKGLSRTKFAEIIDGMSQPTINRQIKGETPLTAIVIDELLKVFPDISAEWLLRGEGEMLRSGGVVNNGNVASGNVGEVHQRVGGDDGNVEFLKEQIREKDKQIEFLQGLIKK